MRPITTILLAAVLALNVNAPAATAAMPGEVVIFQGPPIQPTAFKLKRAKAKGITLAPSPGLELIGTLFRPEKFEPRPAVVMLVGSTGVRPSHLAWGAFLADQGYVTLVIDSFDSRGGTSFMDTPAMDMSVDAFIGYYYLNGLSYVQPGNIGLLGFSMGGGYAQSALDVAMTRRPEAVNFKAGIAFYPSCEASRKLLAPLLIFAGGQDNQMSLARCQALVANSKSADNPVQIELYPEATHFFDNPDYAKDPALRPSGWTQPLWYVQNDFNAAAYGDSQTRVLKFFATYLR